MKSCRSQPNRWTVNRRPVLRWLLLGVIWLVGCTQSPFVWQNRPSADEIRIGLITSLTGDAAPIGESTVRGAELAVQEVNANKGLQVGGRSYKVVLKIENDQDEVDVAVNAARKLVYHDDVAVVIGPQLSRNAIPVAKFLESVQTPMISPRSTNPETTAGKRYIFRATFIDSFQGKVMAQFARQDLMAKTAAVLYDVASAYNRGIAEVFKQVFEAEGGEVVAFESYTTGEEVFQPQLTAIRNQQPDVLFLPNYNYEVALQTPQARQAGIDAIFLGADGWGSLPRVDRTAAEGAFFSDQYSPNSRNPYLLAFLDRFRQAYEIDPDATAAVTYDALNLLFQAIRNQGQSEPEAIRRGLSELGRYDGVTGAIEFRGSGDPIRSVLVLQVKQGQFEVYKQVDP